MPFSDRIIRMRTVLDRTGLSRSTLYRKMAEGTRAMHNRLKSEKEAEIARQQQILGELEAIAEEDREIKITSEEEKQKAAAAEDPAKAHEIRTRNQL